MTSSVSNHDIGARARRRIAWRLLPFVFVLYVVAYVDRVNVSFASLRMNSDLGFSDRVFGLGVGIFYISYVLFEIPGALIVERWSARKWIARIMISWGLVTILTGFIHSTLHFYAARLFLGLAEASFLPGMIVYLTRWFRMRERCRAIACLFAAIPTASLVGSPLAGWLLGVHWHGLPGWRWLFIAEGSPAVLLGLFTLYYLTDKPSLARWLPADERDWLANELDIEQQAKKKIRSYTILEAFRDRNVLLLVVAYFLAMSGALGNVYFIPVFVKRISGLPVQAVTRLLVIPALIGIAAALFNAWHADKTSERRWHTALPLIVAGILYALAILARLDFSLAITLLLLGSGCLYAFYPGFWSMPTMILSDSAAAATLGLITSIGQLGGLFGPYAIGVLNDRTHSLTASFAFIALAYIFSAVLIVCLKIRNPLDSPQTSSP